jgi:hypothetical protein
LSPSPSAGYQALITQLLPSLSGTLTSSGAAPSIAGVLADALTRYQNYLNPPNNPPR